MSNDPYTAKAASTASPAEKIKELRDEVINSSKFAMLTTRSKDGTLHSRAMSPASDKGLVFVFIANNESGKFDDLEHDENVNISFSDASSTNWASVSGKASILWHHCRTLSKTMTDPESIKPFWNPALKAWFGDLGGEKNGTYTDPRVSAIPRLSARIVQEVRPSEINYWVSTRTSIGQVLDVAKSALTGETAAPGHLRTISGSDLEIAKSSEQN
ncbi:BZ3500_MvSof-1268-A1-R1_Chr9g10667 [Microbotryum saponariae]|uniref:BZ3500_MvSof-1268-A1-R1_Chr9g10667 protein n=1 Tax=Microbotryum saponariae TaxID=289078 RepID=A0A2X0N5E8_9BASI|nr:BZ3501_MvSof-1269-A2-R1_Chr9g10415 [Microbotryum saponariae]SDA00486.1 BZ3500_MvSof-1268-A1-R1_Chr9g10667 [Microbotryum saponariae]